MREMKDSGVAWIGKIPKEWDSTKLLNILRCSISDGPHETPELVNENGIPFISVDSLNSTKSVDLTITKKYINQELYDEYNKKTNLECGDILFSKSATIGKTAIIGTEKFMIWSPLAVIKVNKNNSNDYVYYLLNCNEMIKNISLMGTHNTQTNVGMRCLERAEIPVPPLSEQQKIASYLDKKCTQIDKLIENQQKQIEKLKAYKQSLITETVTKGLNPNVPMKDSGVEWIGEIPEDWDIVQLSSIVTERKHRNIGMIETNLLSLSYGNVIKKNINTTDGLLPDSFEGYNIIEVGDIVLRLTDLQNDHKSLRTGLCTERGIITSAYVTIANRGGTLISEYLHYILHTFDIYKGFYGMGAGVRQGLSFEGIKKILLTRPTIKEQTEIVSYLDQKCTQIDSLISIKQKKIEKLQQYKKSVIYEYVTGKKEV